MYKLIVSITSMMLSFSFFSQIKIGNNPTSINSNSVLELESSNKGLLLPRVALLATNNASPLSAHVAGMTVYNTATAGDVTPGHYYNDGTKWVKIASNTDLGWSLTGNAGTNSSTNFIGTTDNTSLRVITNNIERISITNDGILNVKSIGINDTLILNGVSRGRYYTSIVSGSTHPSIYQPTIFTIRDDASTTGTLSRLYNTGFLSQKFGASTGTTMIGLNSTVAEENTATGSLTINGLRAVARKSGSGSGNVTNGTFITQFTPGASGTVNFTGVFSHFNQASGSLTSPTSLTITELLAFNGNVTLSDNNTGSAITVNDAAIYSANFSRNPTSTKYGVTNGYNFWGRGSIGSGTNGHFTNLYGLKIDDISGASTSNFAIHTSVGLNSFGDNIEQRGTGYLKLATGTTAQRPTTATAGMTRFNTTLGGMEFFDGTVWSSVATSASPTNIYTADGTLAGNRIVTQGANTLAFTSTATNGFSVDGTTLSVDAANNRLGLGTVSPSNTLHVAGTTRIETMASGAATDSIVTVDATGVLNKRTVSSVVGNTTWSLTGNAGTNSSTNFIGTTDNTSLQFRTNNNVRSILDTFGRFISVSTGTFNPSLLSTAFVGNNAPGSINVVDFSNNRMTQLRTNRLMFYRQGGPSYLGLIGGSNKLLFGFGTTGDGVHRHTLDSLGFRINANTVVSTSYALEVNPSITGADPIRFVGLNSGSTSDSLVTVNATGVLKRRSIATITADGSETKVNAGTNVTITGAGTTASPYIVNAAGVTDATTTTNGIIRLAGDLSGTAAAPSVVKLQGNVVSATAPTSGQVLSWNGTAWTPTTNSSTNIYNTDGTLTGNRTVTQGANTLAFTSTATNGFSVDGTTLSVDAANNRLGLGTVSPSNTLHVAGTTRIETMASGAATDSIVTVDATGVLNKRTVSSVVGNTAWSLTGNAGTDSSTNFIGTTDNTSLRVRTNNIERISITNDGILNVKSIGINDTLIFNGVSRGRYYTSIVSGSTHPSIYQPNNFILRDDASTTGTLSRLHNAGFVTQKFGSSIGTTMVGLNLLAAEENTATGSLTINGLRAAARKSGSGSGNVTNGTFFTQFTPGASGTVNFTGVFSQFNQASGSLTSPTSLTITELLAFNGNVTLSDNNTGSAITVNDAAIYSANFSRNPTSTKFSVTNGYNFWGRGSIGSGTNGHFTNLYGLKIDDISGASTSNFAIHTSVGLNSFGDNIEQRGTGYLKLATGTTAQRPTTATAGMTRFNTTLGGMEFFDGTTWVRVSNAAVADQTSDAWINNVVNTRVELGTTSTGASRAANAGFYITDAGQVRIGLATIPTSSKIIVDGENNTLGGVVYSSALAINSVDGNWAGFLGTTNEAGLANKMYYYSGRGGGGHIFGTNTTPSGVMGILNNGNVGIGTTAPTTQLHTTGGVRFQGLTGVGTRMVVTDADGVLSTQAAPAAQTGSTSVILNGTNFERAALTGDVTAAQNSNALKISNDAVTSAKIFDGTIATADLADGSITAAKLNQMSATSGQALTWNGTNWEPSTIAAADGSETKVNAGTNVTITGAGTTASPYIVNAAGVADATTSTNGIIRLAGDLSGTAAAPTVANNAISSAKILDGTIAAADLNQMAATSGQALTWNGTVWAPATITSTNIYNTDGTLTGNRVVTQGANTLAFTSTATNGFSVDGTTLSVDAANNRVGIGTISPFSPLVVESTNASAPSIAQTLVNRSSNTGTSVAINFAASNAPDSRYASIAGEQRGSNRIDLVFSPGAGSTIVEQMRLDSFGNLGVGTNAPTSTIHSNGTFALNTATSGTANSVVLLATGTFTPPTASTVSGRIYIIRNTSTATNVSVASVIDYGASSAATFTLTPAIGSVMIISDGTSWFRIQ